jgi:Zn-dependent protease with chaperone function
MKSYFAHYRAYRSGADVESTVLIFDKNLNIGFKDEHGHNQMISWLIKDVSAYVDFSLRQSRLKHTNGSELFIEGTDAAGFIDQLKEEQKKPWYRKSNGNEILRNSLLMVFILGALFAIYLLIVPWLSQQLASKVSIRTERQLGDGVHDALRLSEQEDTAQSKILNEFFAAMDVQTAYQVRISVIREEITNAFALPGGRIVVYTGLLKEIKTYPELAALLGHEFTHINNRHATKSIFRQLGSKIFLNLLFGKIGAVTSIVINHADNLRNLKYSRKLEKEADTEGVELLMKRKIDPQGFEDLFNHLKASGPVNSLPEFLGSHPDVNKRIRYIKEKAEGAVVAEDAELKAIFEKLKN